MPTELPSFLQEFVKHRQHVVKNAPTPAELKKTALTPASKVPELDLGVKGIIDKKPPRKVLDEFLQKRCDELTALKLK
jgi:hypothetical protein